MRFVGLVVALCLPAAAVQARTVVRTLGASDDRYMPSVAGSVTGWQASIPPLVESGAIAAPGGGYCFAGNHPTTLADSDAGEPGTWHESQGVHKHTYAPLDLRLFTYDGKCYQFTGDPSDFGAYAGLHAFHGMHPAPPEKGGGWCYQDGDHNHGYRVRSPYMQRIAEKSYWGGGFDAQFRVYYPYYVHFFRDLYPIYYAEGLYVRNRATAPSITHVAMPAEMINWGPDPAPETRPEAPPAPPPPPLSPTAVPSSMDSATTVIIATPPFPAGYGYGYGAGFGYQQYGAPLGYGHGHGHGSGFQPNPRNAAPSAPPAPAPPEPIPTQRREYRAGPSASGGISR